MPLHFPNRSRFHWPSVVPESAVPIGCPSSRTGPVHTSRPRHSHLPPPASRAFSSSFRLLAGSVKATWWLYILLPPLKESMSLCFVFLSCAQSSDLLVWVVRCCCWWSQTSCWWGLFVVHEVFWSQNLWVGLRLAIEHNHNVCWWGLGSVAWPHNIWRYLPWLGWPGLDRNTAFCLVINFLLCGIGYMSKISELEATLWDFGSCCGVVVIAWRI